MKTIKIIETGRVWTVENNVAHGFLDRGLAVIWTKEMEEPQQNKMMSKKKNKKIKTK